MLDQTKKYQIHELAVNDLIRESRKTVLCENNDR